MLKPPKPPTVHATVSGEVMTLRSANTECNSRLDVAANGFGGGSI